MADASRPAKRPLNTCARSMKPTCSDPSVSCVHVSAAREILRPGPTSPAASARSASQSRADAAGDVDDHRGGGFLEQRDTCTQDTDGSEHVRFIDRAHVFSRRFAGRDASTTDACVVDEHVQNADGVNSRRGPRCHRSRRVGRIWHRPSSAACWPRARSRAPIQTRWPAAASRRATSKPRPLFAPVMSVVVIVPT